MEIVRLPLKSIEMNTGQIEGLPTNPRQWTKTDIDTIAKSLKETPELFEMRPCIVMPHDGKNVLLGGNLRYCGAKQNKDKDVPCIIVPEDTPVEKLKEIVIKDNGAFGAWDFDLLANEWDDLPLVDWGVPAWGTEDAVAPDEFGTEFSLPDGEKPPFQQMAFTFADEQAEIIKDAITGIKQTDEYKYCETFGNENSNGNAIYLIVQQWADAKK